MSDADAIVAWGIAVSVAGIAAVIAYAVYRLGRRWAPRHTYAAALPLVGGLAIWRMLSQLAEPGYTGPLLMLADPVRAVVRTLHDLYPAITAEPAATAVLLAALTSLPLSLVAVVYLSLMRTEWHQRGTDVGDVTGAPSLPVAAPVIKIGGVTIPERLEARGIGMSGAQGTGKTQAILGILRAARARGDRVILVDSAGDIMSQMYESGDTILSPGDARSVAWSPYADLYDLSECETLAASLIPPGHGGESQTWHGYARTLVSALLRRTLERGETTTGALMHYATVADGDELDALVKGLPAARFTAPGADRTLSSTLSIVGGHLSALGYLDPRAGVDSFSLRRWLSEGEGWLWMPYRDSSAEATKPLRRTWLDLIVRGIFDLPPDDSRRIWVVLDELPSHGQLEILPHAAARGRKYGLRLVLGYQAASQLREVYGRDGAESILSCTGHTLILRTPDPDTADRLSRQVGDVERERVQRSSSSSSGGQGGGSRSDSQTIVREVRRAVLPSEIQQLPDLSGYLIVGGDAVRRVRVPIVRGLERSTPTHIPAEPLPPYTYSPASAPTAAAPAAAEKPAPAPAPAPVPSLSDIRSDLSDRAGELEQLAQPGDQRQPPVAPKPVPVPRLFDDDDDDLPPGAAKEED